MEDTKYDSLTAKDLKALCKERKIIGYSKKNKNELINLLNGEVKKEQKKENKPKPKPKNKKETTDKYTEEILKERYYAHKEYVTKTKEFIEKTEINIRLPCIPEDISENIIKFIIHNKLGDKTSIWNTKTGDLFSQNEGKQECKCFTSDGPLSFTPSSEWDVIYFLNAKDWINDNYVLYKINLQRNSEVWKNIKINKTQTFEDQCKQGRRPRMNFDLLQKQLKEHCLKVFEGNFENIFIHHEFREDL